MRLSGSPTSKGRRYASSVPACARRARYNACTDVLVAPGAAPGAPSTLTAYDGCFTSRVAAVYCIVWVNRPLFRVNDEFSILTVSLLVVTSAYRNTNGSPARNESHARFVPSTISTPLGRVSEKRPATGTREETDTSTLTRPPRRTTVLSTLRRIWSCSDPITD